MWNPFRSFSVCSSIAFHYHHIIISHNMEMRRISCAHTQNHHSAHAQRGELNMLNECYLLRSFSMGKHSTTRKKKKQSRVVKQLFFLFLRHNVCVSLTVSVCLGNDLYTFFFMNDEVTFNLFRAFLYTSQNISWPFLKIPW